MAVISKTLLYADKYVTENAFYTQAFPYIFLAPYAFVDSAVSLTAFPLNTAVTVGQKFLNPSSGVNGDRFYFEIVTAGTTGSSFNFTSFASSIVANESYTSGTAVFRPRASHGWARAINSYRVTNMYNTGTHLTTLFANTATIDRGTLGIILSVWGTDSLGNSIYTMRGLFSVSKASGDRPTTYQAGGLLQAFWENSKKSTEEDLMVVRGMTLKNTAPDTSMTTNGRETGGYWRSGRYMDCTFQVNLASSAFNSARFVAHTGTFRALRCTFSNLATTGTYSQPVFGSDYTLTASADVPTFTRSRSSTATTDPILTALGLYGSVLSAAEQSFYLLGGNLSGINQTSFAHLPPNVDSYAAVDAWGTNWNATYPPQRLDTSANQAYSGAGSTAYDKVRYVDKDRTYTRQSGATDGFALFSLKVPIGFSQRQLPLFYFMNTRVTEGFTISFDLQYTAVAGISGLSEEDIWIDALYYTSPSTFKMEYASSIQNSDTRPGLFETGTGPRILPTTTTTWNGALASAVKQRMSVVVSPRRQGMIVIRIRTQLCPWTRSKIASEPLTVYLCPKPILSAA